MSLLFSFVCLAQAESGTSAGKITKSSVGAIGAFAKDWGWSKERHQDGEFAEVKLSIKLPASFNKATLVLQHGYSQQSGEAKAEVYLSTEAQVAPEDEAHHKGNWWVGKAAKPGQVMGTFSTQYQASFTRLDVTEFLQTQPTQTYYVAVKNLDLADMGMAQIYIEVEDSSTGEAAPAVKEASSQPSLMEKAVGKPHDEALKEYRQKTEEVKATREKGPVFKDIDDAFPPTVNGLERRESDKDEWGRRFVTYVASDAKLTNEEIIKGLKVYTVIPDHIMVTILEDTKRTAPISIGDWKNKAESASKEKGGQLIHIDDFPVIYKTPFNNPVASCEFDLDYYNINIAGRHRYANEEEMKKAAKDMIDHFLKVVK